MSRLCDLCKAKETTRKEGLLVDGDLEKKRMSRRKILLFRIRKDSGKEYRNTK